MASNVINRYVWLLNTLLQEKELSFSEISKRWANSGLGDNKPLARRTFILHKHAIEEMFNVIIDYSSSSRRYFVRDADKFKSGRVCRWLLESLAVANVVEAGHNMTDRIVFEEVPGGVEYIQVVIKAMQMSRVLRIEYKQFEGEQKTLAFRPYAMKIYNRRWYVVGRASERGRIINIALDRVQTMDITEESFVLPEDFDAKEFYFNSVGIFVNEEDTPQWVTIRAYGVRREYLRTLPLHHSQEEVATTEEYSDFRYYLCLSSTLNSSILSMGNDVEVLAPQALCNQIRDIALKMVSRYK